MRKGAKFSVFRCLCGQIWCYKFNHRDNREKALRPQRDFLAVVIPNPIAIGLIGDRNAISFKVPACAGITILLLN